MAAFGLKEKAERLGARVALLDPEQHQDVAALARSAVSDEGGRTDDWTFRVGIATGEALVDVA